ncbi:MAG TPA: hypothetical protein VGO78_11330 [Acidimicrobiales bacterium]|nr:hypothetical protein [Acidimicrobiales bacterium]
MSVDSPPAPPMSDSTDDEPADGPPLRRWRPTRILILVVVAGLLAMWGYVLYLAFGPGRQPPIDRIDDHTFAIAAESRCAEAVDHVGELPLANEAHDPAERAAVLDEANATFAAMLDDLDGMTTLVPAGHWRENTTEWLADWRIFLADREDFADRLRTDPDARMLVSEKEGERRHITEWIDEFALANHMASCASPTDA